MSALAETWHIMKKDVRQSRWLLLGYVVLVVAATASAVTGGELAGGHLQMAAVLLMLTGPITAAILVQADSPTRADAFWASQPFRRSAMLGAKLVMVMLVFGIAMAGQLIALAVLHVSARDMRRIMLLSGLIYGCVLLLAMFLATLTSDLKSFVLSVLALFAATAVVSIGTSAFDWLIGLPALRTTMVGAGLVGVVALLVLLYLRRDLPAARSLAVLALAMIILGSLSTGPPEIGTSRSGIIRGQVDGAAGIRVELRDTAQITRTGEVNLGFALTDGEKGRHYHLIANEARFFLRGGGSVDVPWWTAELAQPAGQGLAVSGVPPLPVGSDPLSGANYEVQRSLSDEQRRGLARGIDSVRISGTLTVLEPRLAATLPAHAGAEILRDGQSIRVASISLDGSGQTIELRIKSIARSLPGADWSSDRNALSAWLIDEQHGDRIELLRGAMRYSGVLLVLPGAGFTEGTVRFSAPRMAHDIPLAADPESLASTKLVLVTWVPVTMYGVQASSIPLPPDSGRVHRRSSSSHIDAGVTVLRAHR